MTVSQESLYQQGYRTILILLKTVNTKGCCNLYQPYNVNSCWKVTGMSQKEQHLQSSIHQYISYHLLTYRHGGKELKGIDYGYAAESCCLWGVIDPEDKTLIIYRELYRKGLTGEALGDTIDTNGRVRNKIHNWCIRYSSVVKDRLYWSDYRRSY